MKGSEMKGQDVKGQDMKGQEMTGKEMTCFEFRQRVGADPTSKSAALHEHRLGCPPCAEFYRQQLALSESLARALEVPVPDQLAPRIQWRAANESPAARRWIAAAAGLVAAVTLSFMVWLGDAEGPLPEGVVAHVQDEARIMQVSDTRVSAQKVNAVLYVDNLEAAEDLGDVTHAGLCPFRGHLIPHLVVEMDGQPVSVLFLANESVDRVEQVHEDGYHGIIVPAKDGGSMAIVAEREDLLLPVVEEMRHKIRWGI